MPDPDLNAAEPMDSPGTRVTPEPDEHPGHEGSRDAVLNEGNAGENKANPDDTTTTEGGTGTSGTRGGGPAADFSDQR
jgi:hypothetical protein